MKDSTVVASTKSTKAQPKRRSKRRVKATSKVKAPKVTPTSTEEAVAVAVATSPEHQESVSKSNIARIQLSSTAKGALDWARSHIESLGMNRNNNNHKGGESTSTSSKNEVDDEAVVLAVAGAGELGVDGDDASMNKIDSVSKKLDDDDDDGNKDVNNKCDTTEGHLEDDVQKNGNGDDTETCTDASTSTNNSRTHEHEHEDEHEHSSSTVSKSANVSCSDEEDDVDVTTAANAIVDFAVANVAKKGNSNEDEDLSKSASDDTEDSLTVMIQRANDALLVGTETGTGTGTSEVDENIEEGSDDCEKKEKEKDKGGTNATTSDKENEADDDDGNSNNKENASRDDGQDNKDDNNESAGAGIQSIASMLERADSALQAATHLETEEQVVEKRDKKQSLDAIMDEEVQMAINKFGTTTPALCDNDTSTCTNTSVASKISHHQTHASNSTNATVVSVEVPQYQGPLHNDYSRSTHNDGALSNSANIAPRQAVPERMENSPYHQGMISQALGSLETLPIHPRQEYTREQQWQNHQQGYYEQQQRWQHQQQQMRWQWQRHQQEQEIRWKNAQKMYWQERNHSQLMSENATNKIPLEPEQRQGNNVTCTALDEIEQNQQQQQQQVINHAKALSERSYSAIQETMRANATQQTEKEIRQWLFQQQQERISRRNSYEDARCAASIIRDMADGHAESSSNKESKQQTQQQQHHQDIAHDNDCVNDLLELASKEKKQGQQHPSDEPTKQSVNSKMPMSQSNSEHRERAEEEQEEELQFQENDKESERQTQQQQDGSDGHLELMSKEQHASGEDAEQIINSKMPPSQSDGEPLERGEKEEEEKQFSENDKESGEQALQQQDDVGGHLELASKEQNQDQHSNDKEVEQKVNSKMPLRQSSDELREREGGEQEEEKQFLENEKNHPIYIYRIAKSSMNQQVEQIEQNLENTTGMNPQTGQSSRKTLQQQQHDRTNVEDRRNGGESQQTHHNNKEETMNKVQGRGNQLRGPGGTFIRRNQQHKLPRSVGQDPNELDKGNNSTSNGNKKRKLDADNSIAGEQHNLRPRRSLRSTQRYISSGSDRVILNNAPNPDLEANLEVSLLKTKSPQSKGLLRVERTLGQKRRILDSCDDSQERSRSNVKRVSQDRVGPLQCIHIEKQAVVEDTHIDSIPIARCWNPSCRAEHTLSNLMRCTQCEKALYCNQNCQIAHWDSNHSQTCKPPKFRAQDGPEQPGNELNASPTANRQTAKEVVIQDADPFVVASPAPPAITIEQIQTLVDNKMAETARALNARAAEQRKLFDEKLKETVLRLNAETEKERKILDTELKKKDESIHVLQLQVREQSEINLGKMIDEKIKKTVDVLQHQVGEEKVIIEQKLKERDATIHTLHLQVNKQAEEGRKLLDQRIKETILTIQLQSEDERGILDNKLKERDSTIRTLQLQVEKLEKDMRRSFGQTKRVDDL